MVRFSIMDPRDVSVVRGHPSTKKHNFLRKVPITADLPTAAQAEARLSLSRFATANLYGVTGTVVLPDGRRISQGAYTVMTRYPNTGVGAFGGQTNEQRASMKHELAPASIRKQEERIQRMRGSMRGAAPSGRFPSIPL